VPGSDDLDAGDLVWVELDPIRGREQSGRRPAVVMTPSTYHRVSHIALVCPITSNLGPWPFKALLPDGLEIGGAVLVDQVRAVDRSHRIVGRAGRVPDETLDRIRGILVAMIRPEE
jgi:mRNA-degrading endonuclease toxin of MazEF toxin-antitoxin module